MADSSTPRPGGPGGRLRDTLWTLRLLFPEGRGARLEAAEEAMSPGAMAVSSYEVDGGPAWAVEALCRSRRAAHTLRRDLVRRGLATAGAAEAAPVPPRDWVRESRRHLPALRIGRFFVHGTHVRQRPPPGTFSLTLDAGLAFGTGRHATTALCLQALDRLARRRRVARPLDLGCGSGILALAMARLWRVPVLAADNDPQAVAVARENALRNGLDGLVRVVLSRGYGGAALRRAAPFDLIAANILAGPLRRLAPALARRLAPDGVAILSGLMSEQEDEVLEAHRRQGLDLVERRRRDDWSMLMLAPKWKRRTPRGDRR